MPSESEQPVRAIRRDARLAVAWSCACEKIVQIEQTLDPALARVFERVKADTSGVGERFTGVLRDVSQGGAFIEGRALPLLSRVALAFEVPGYKNVEAVGWVLWRRTADCTIPREGGGEPQKLGAGFGVVFEYLPLEARVELARRVAQRG